MYVSLSCVELDFVHLRLTIQVQIFTPKFPLLTLIHVACYNQGEFSVKGLEGLKKKRSENIRKHIHRLVEQKGNDELKI